MTKELIEDILLEFTDNGATLNIEEDSPIFLLRIELFNHTKGDTRLYDRLKQFSLPYNFNIASVSEVVYDRGKLVQVYITLIDISDGKCGAITKRGDRCKYRYKEMPYCKIHSNYNPLR